ncbi:unnamed protein product [Cochlearia groenlandica]
MRRRKRPNRALYWIERRKIMKAEKLNKVDSLPNSLLEVEIFSRLTNPRDLLVCKGVSKRWNSLISSLIYKYPKLALILNREDQCVATNDMCLDDWKGFDLNKYVDPNDSPVRVLSSFQDILLCTKPPSKEFYIVNPMTMQWTILRDHGGFCSKSVLPIGLIGDSRKGIFYVVRLWWTSPSMFRGYLFDSSIGKWRTFSFEHSSWSQSGWCPTQYQGLGFKGFVHWLAEDGPVVGRGLRPYWGYRLPIHSSFS